VLGPGALLHGLSARLRGAVLAAALILLASPAARAVDDEAEAAEADRFLAKYYPAPVEGPPLRPPGMASRLWVDGTYAATDDLTALPYVAGTGQNLRFAAGGTLRWRRFAFTGELPFTQVTTLDVTAIPGGAPIPEDAHQTAVSLGDLRLGVDWSQHLTPWLLGGFGLRGRFPTHTTRFQFHLIDGSLASYAFPYYFHVDPAAILGGKLGRFTFVLNQGAVILLGPDGNFGDQHIVVPTIVFWDAAYAVSYSPVDALAASFQVATDIQLNHVDGIEFQKLNDVRSVWIAPALQFHLADYRVDAIARWGVTRGADLFGVIQYAGSSSYTLRVSRNF
jgi:hypothetical protein